MRAYLVAAAVCVGAGSVANTRAGTVAGPLGHEYEVIAGDVTWTQANTAAKAVGGYLATVGDATEQTFVEGLLSSQGAASGAYWFGLHETATEGDYRFLNGVAPSYTNWLVGQPDNFGGHETAGSILWSNAGDQTLSRRGMWNDLPENNLGYPQVQSVYPDLVAKGYVVEFFGPGGPTHNTGDEDDTVKTIPLPAAVYSFPVLAVVAGWALRRKPQACQA